MAFLVILLFIIAFPFLPRASSYVAIPSSNQVNCGMQTTRFFSSHSHFTSLSVVLEPWIISFFIKIILTEKMFLNNDTWTVW
jgi:hypothetical protein